ncbi:MAG: FtsX-like permease family protein [Armatimonadota bacterium]
MSLWRLIIRSLWHYRRTNLAVLFGLAVATAVITGSLIVGDSVTGSVRDTAFSRLGKVRIAVVARHPFRAQLADELTEYYASRPVQQPQLVHAPVFTASGTVTGQESGAAVPNVTVLGIDNRFWQLFPETSVSISGRDVAVNAALARDLGIRAGDTLLLTVGKNGIIPAGNLFADRSRNKLLRTLRLRVAAILSDRGAGGFTLSNGTMPPRNLFLANEHLCTALETSQQQATMLLIERDEDTKAGPTLDSLIDRLLGRHKAKKSPGQFSDEVFAALMPGWYLPHWQPADYGLQITPNGGTLQVQSDEFVLPEATVAAARQAAKAHGGDVSLSSVYLAKTISTAKPGVKYDVPPPSLAYALVAGVEPGQGFTFRAGGGSAPSKGGIWLNTWAAEDLHAKIGQPVTLEYLVPQPDGSYRTEAMPLRVEGIVEIAGPAADRNLVPPLQGITDTDTIGEWEAPFPLDMQRVTPRDDEYWAQYRTTPKAFISLDAAQTMWRRDDPKADWVTTVQVHPPQGMSPAAFTPKFTHSLLQSNIEELVNATLQRQYPLSFGGAADIRFLPVREQAKAASRTTTDFGQLFLSMSFFLVLAAVGLAGMLMRLTVERRAAEAGIMAACGFGTGQVRRALWGEGALLALGGMLLGVPLGLGYAAAIIGALGSWWAGAVGGAALWLHLSAGALVIGGVSGLIVGLLAMIWGTWSLGKRQVLDLLAGWRAAGMMPGRARIVVSLVFGGLLILAVLLVVLAIGRKVPADGAFFGVGALLLCAGICGGYLVLARWLHSPLTFPTLARLAMRSAAANRGRSLLVMGLLAGAGFIIVAVAANVRDFSRLDVHRKDSGAGGFALRAVSTVPLPVDISTPTGREHLGFSPEDEALFKDVSIFPLLYSGGDDISCLNLATAQQPRVLGISQAMIERGGFTVLTKEKAADPWSLLQSEEAVFGDADSVMWSLHSALDGKVTLTGSAEQRDGKFVGLLPGSIFAGELLVSEEHFRQLYPEITRPRYYLIETPPGKEDAVAEALRRNLGDFGLEVRGTRELLNAYIGVQNTYLSTFLALGGLGLMLGTLGLVIVLLRNALERRKEFALLLAQGFTERELAAMLAIENAGLLVAGLLCGTVTALIAVAPHLASVAAQVNWGALIVVLVGILVVGLTSCYFAARAATRGRLLEALREE